MPLGKPGGGAQMAPDRSERSQCKLRQPCRMALPERKPEGKPKDPFGRQYGR